MKHHDTTALLNSALKANKRPWPRAKRLSSLLGIPLILLGLLAITIKHLPFLLNITPSMPMGIYHINQVTHIRRGEDVVVCLPDAIAQVGLNNHYIHASHECSSGAEPLLKQVIALPGDQVWVTEHHMIVNGMIYAAFRLSRSPEGHVVKSWIKPGHYVAQGYWLYGQTEPYLSWDSRYYGGVPKRAIIKTVKPVWVYTPASKPITFLLKRGAHVQTH